MSNEELLVQVTEAMELIKYAMYAITGLLIYYIWDLFKKLGGKK